MKKFNFGFFKKISEKIKGFYDKNKKLFIVMVVLILIGIALVFSTLSSLLKPKEKTAATKPQVQITEYAAQIENKLESMLLQLDGITSASAFVMVDATPKIEYLIETQENTTTNESGVVTSSKSTTVVFEKNGSISTPVVVTTIMPKITGVLVIVNKIDPLLKNSIIRALTAVLNVNESCINILQES